MLFDDEDLEQALRQLVLYGHDGLPVLSHDEHTLQGSNDSTVVAASEGPKLVPPRADIELRAGGRIVLLAPATASAQGLQRKVVVSQR